MALTHHWPQMHEQFNEYPWEHQNRNHITEAKSYMALQLGHHVVWVTPQGAEGVWNIVKNIELSDNTTLSIPVRGQVHTITKDQLARLKTQLEAQFGSEPEPE